MKVMSQGISNAKIRKSEKLGRYSTALLNLAPYKESGVNFCANASPGCIATCLFTAGRGVMAPVRKGRLRRSHEFIADRNQFIADLKSDLSAHVRRCEKNKKRAASRLNAMSDLTWEAMGIPQAFPSVQFYDYTASPKRARMFGEKHPAWPKNYYLTFSRKENNEAEALELLKIGVNVSVVFRKELPKKWKGYRVIDGDKTDLRFTDPRGVVVGLIAKGKAKKDTSGFVVDL